LFEKEAVRDHCQLESLDQRKWTGERPKWRYLRFGSKFDGPQLTYSPFKKSIFPLVESIALPSVSNLYLMALLNVAETEAVAETSVLTRRISVP